MLYADVISFSASRKCQNFQTIIENSEVLLNDFWNFSEIFRKDVAYDNIKINKKEGLQHLYRKPNFEKPTKKGERGEIEPPATFLGLTDSHKMHWP